MGHILTFALFESRNGLKPKQEEFLNEWIKGTWSFDKSTGLVDVDGDFDCVREGLKGFKGIRFGKVSGNFFCQDNSLKNLEGAPQKVGGDFDCSGNPLTSLSGSPREVGGYFNCRNYPNFVILPSSMTLNSLAEGPERVDGDFDCRGNNLTSLEGAPREVGGGFDCSKNNLTSLEGAPGEVGGNFKCDEFELEKGEWNMKGWSKVLAEGSEGARMLISTIFSPEVLNREISENPSGMVMTLKGVWNDPNFREIRNQLKIPDRLKPEMELLGDLGELGF